MSNVKFQALMGASALVMAFGAAASANAAIQTATAPVTIYGGGSTLVQPYIRQAEDCFGAQVPTWDKSNPPVAITEPYYNFQGAAAQNCATTQADANVTLQYQGAGSGGGILGVFTHDPHNFASVGNYTPAGSTTGAYWPTLHYGAADLPLGANDLAVYDNGGTVIPTPNKTTNIQGSNNPSGTIANPLATYGALVQYPALIAPVALTYSPVYKKVFNTATSAVTSYQFHLATSKVATGGVTYVVPTLKLDAATYCGIFNGYIKDWNDPAIAALNAYKVSGGTANGPAGTPNAKKLGVYVGGVFYANGTTVNSIEDQSDPTPAASFSVPIELVGRSDSSGTTGIFTRHLEYACSKYLPAGETNKIVAGPTLPSAVIGTASTAGPGTGLFTVKNGSDALAAYLKFADPTASAPTATQGKIGYLGPDYINPYSATATGLYGAALKNNFDSKYYLPGPRTALAAFGAVQPPESDATGAYVPAADQSGATPLRSQPFAWVEPLSKTSALAQAGDTLAGAYAITGTTNLLAYTCYADATANSVNNVGVQLNQFLTWYNSSATVTGAVPATPGILAARGFADLPKAWKLAVKQTFLAPTTTGTNPTNALKLWVSSKTDALGPNTGTVAKPKQKVLFAHNPACDSVTGG